MTHTLKRKISLKRKIFVSGTIILSWCGIVFLIIVHYFMTYALHRTHILSLQSKANHMKESIVPNMHDQPKLLAMLKQWVAEDTILSYAFVSHQDKVVACTASFPAETLREALGIPVSEPGQQFLVVDHATFLQLAYPLGQQSVLYLGSSLMKLESALKTMRWLFVLLALTFAGFGIGVIYSFVVFFTRPISELAEAVRHVDKGDLNYRLPRDWEDEIGMVANSFNQMMDSLQKNLAQIQRSEKLAVVGELAAGVAHEINNPLDGLQNSIRLIRKDPHDIEQMNMLLPLMAEALDRIEFIVKKLLTFARKQSLQKAEIAADHLIADSLEFVMHKIKARQIQLDYVPAPSPVLFPGDERQLSQALINVMLNAIDSMERGGRLVIRCAYGDMQGRPVADISVQDSGCGIAPEILGKIFDPFFTTKKDGKGTGLGLTVSLNIVREHGGEIEVKSVMHHGSTFTIRIPKY